MDDRAKIFALLEKALTRLRPLASLYSRPYMGVVEREVKLADIGGSDVIVNIGCGAIPFTAIYLARLTGAEIIALDKDKKATECARRYIKDRGLDDIIRVVWGEGAQSVECLRATAWMVALQAVPKNAILNHFFERAPQGARIMFREPRSAFASRYDQLTVSTRPQSVTNHNMIAFNRSVLFVQAP